MMFEQYPKTPNVAFDDPVVISRKDILCMTGAETEKNAEIRFVRSAISKTWKTHW